MISQAKKVVTKTNPEYDLVMKRLHLYYDMKLAAFGKDQHFGLHYTIPSICTTL